MLLIRPRADRLSTTGPTPHSWSTARPANDALGARDDDRYSEWLASEWGPLAPSREELARACAPGGTVELLTSIATDASRPDGAAIDYAALAPLLAEIRWQPGGAMEVQALLPLAAWSLTAEIERGLNPLVACPTCNRPWFTKSLGSGVLDNLTEWHCPRPAPGLTMTCAQLQAHDRFARTRQEWSREYRRIMARKVRGTVSEDEFRAWKATSGPGERGKDWIPFDEWKVNTEEE